MNTDKINIDFEALGKTFGKYIREKAAAARTTITYKQGDQLIEEDPRSGNKKVIKEYSPAHP